MEGGRGQLTCKYNYTVAGIKGGGGESEKVAQVHTEIRTYCIQCNHSQLVVRFAIFRSQALSL